MNDAATLVNILQALAYVFLQGLSTIDDARVDDMTADDVTLAREDWDTFLSSPRGTERVVVDHRDLRTYRLVVQ